VPLRDVQEAASHADPRTTMRYDRARASLDLQTRSPDVATGAIGMPIWADW
jgi:integrase/recombinase XerD